MMPITNSHSLEQASIYSDLNSLDSIRKQGLSDEVGAIKKAAKEFEAFFLNMMLKSMRQANEVIGENNLFGSEQEKMFTSMMDEQLSVDLAHKGVLGIAELMMAQLVEGQSKETIGKISAVDMNLKDYQSQEKKHKNNEGTNNTKIKVLNSDVEISLKENKVREMIINNPSQAEPLDNSIEKSASTSGKLETPSKKPLFEQASKFIESLFPYAKETAEKLSLDPKVLLAQAALETGWGKFIMHDEHGKPGFNLFGIKANKNWQGEKINIDTLEVENNQFKKINAAFRKYDSFAESFEDYANFIMSDARYHDALKSASNPQEYTKRLQQAGYATDPNYAKKIMSIFSNRIMSSFSFENLASDASRMLETSQKLK